MKKRQLEMYKERQSDLLKQYNGKIISVKDGECLGDFPTILDAYRAMEEKGLSEGEYIIVKCTPGDSEYTAFFANWFPIAEFVNA